ncbi:MAG TPA: hypothetical protein VM870_04920, partial [Pyrinomonadaceae bacterium]|nr:hypothetical protein [Pyrinomonadaceae bacterium]
MASIQQAVGLKCANSKYDVIVVQTLLNKFLIAGCLPPLAPLLVDGDFGNKTAEAIYAFQNGVMGWKKPDMRIDPWGQTIAALNGPLKWANKPFGGGGTYLPPPSAPDDLTYGDPVTITAMDATDRHVWAVSWGKIVYLSDAWTMTLNVQKEAGSSPIGRLYVLSHGWHDGPRGSPDQLQLRNNAVTAENFSIWEPAFRRLRPHFADSGEVVLLACLVGQNSALLRKLSASFQVPVYAGTGYTLMKSGAQTG